MTETLVLSALEFDVVWEAERLPSKHVALDVPSPGITHSERALLVERAFDSLAARGLAKGGRAVPELADRLALLAYPQVSVDVWVWTDREIAALAAGSGGQAMLGAVDKGEVWLIPARATALADAAVSMAGNGPAGPGRSISLPTDVLEEADARCRGDAQRLTTILSERDIPFSEAQALSAMVTGMAARGQFGAERLHRDQRRTRAPRVVSFHDTAEGRYLYLKRPANDGRMWSTITPADNARITACVWELLDEA
ncbi:ESX secretion-associated protein EspG [Actinokineospora guangxiensis]|uniref:ESX secretion-associated protein EspG n=1 Tax=Actinokineospora guangxiensis TaxID=1490288 RepID=A0ABW0EFB1_9PSEU